MERVYWNDEWNQPKEEPIKENINKYYEYLCWEEWNKYISKSIIR